MGSGMQISRAEAAGRSQSVASTPQRAHARHRTIELATTRERGDSSGPTDSKERPDRILGANASSWTLNELIQGGSRAWEKSDPAHWGRREAKTRLTQSTEQNLSSRLSRGKPDDPHLRQTCHREVCERPEPAFILSKRETGGWTRMIPRRVPPRTLVSLGRKCFRIGKRQSLQICRFEGIRP